MGQHRCPNFADIARIPMVAQEAGPAEAQVFGNADRKTRRRPLRAGSGCLKLPAREPTMNFASDNVMGASAPILQTLSDANEGAQAAYAEDPITKRVEQRFCDIFEREVAVLLVPRSEEHTSELQSQSNLVCR